MQIGFKSWYKPKYMYDEWIYMYIIFDMHLSLEL